MGKNIPYQGWSWVQTHPWDILQLDRDSTGFLHLSYNMYNNHWLSEISFLYGDGKHATDSKVMLLHDDVIKRKHFPRYWSFVRGIHRSPQSFDVFFDLCLNKRLSKQLWGWWFETPSGSLWRHYNGPFNAPSTHVSSQLWRVVLFLEHSQTRTYTLVIFTIVLSIHAA